MEGDWVTDPTTLKNMAVDFYKNLYTYTSSYEDFIVKGCFPNLSERDCANLSLDICWAEVRQALFDMGVSKPLVQMGIKLCSFKVNGISLEILYLIWLGGSL